METTVRVAQKTQLSGIDVMRFFFLNCGSEVAGTYGIVRPYSGGLGAGIETFLDSLGVSLGVTQPVAPGTPDEIAARTLARCGADLLVVPFHFHRGAEKEGLDGVGVLLSLPESFDPQAHALFMPVRGFSWSASFQPRMEELRAERPEIAERLIVAHEKELESLAVLARVKGQLEEVRKSSQRREGPLSTRVRASLSPVGLAPQETPTLELLPVSQSPLPSRPSAAWKFSGAQDNDRAATEPPHSGDRPSHSRAIADILAEPKKSGEQS